ncbi:MAG: glycosyltransferase [Myxococcota bacterium]
MAKDRFLFVTWNGGGNTAPRYPLVRSLVARGHKVTILGQSAQAGAARELGARFAPLGVPDWTAGKSLEEEPELFSVLLGPAVGEAVLAHLERDAPDVLVLDCMLSSALAAAERSKIPSATIVHVLYHQLVRGTMAGMWSSMLPAINEMRTGFGLSPVESPAALMDPMNVVLVASPQEFDVPMPDLPSNVRYIGAILGDPSPPERKSPWRSADGQPRVLVTFGTTCQHQEDALCRVAAALAGLTVQAVITVGPAVDPSAIDPAPNVAVHRYIPHRAVLPDCALVVTHAGLGAVMASLAHGIPLLCMPMGREQHDNAARVAACGAGRVLGADAGVDEIRRTIREILRSPDCRDGARRMAATIALQDGRTAAVKELEALLPAS